MRDPEKATPGGNRANAEDTKENGAIVTQQAATCLDKIRHPLSAAFGDMPADEFAELVRDIKRNGQISDIVKAADGSILDGWHRYRACIEAGITPRIEPFSYIIEAAAETAGRTLTEAEFVVAQNAHRRHLTAEQRRKIVGELLKADPAKSDRAIGSMANVDGKTVGAVRAKLEATAEIPQLPKTTGKDGKARPKPKPAGFALADKVKRATAAADESLRAMEGKPPGPRGPGSRNVVIVEGVEVLDPGHARPTPPLAAAVPPVVPTICVDDIDEQIAAYEAEEKAARAALPLVQEGHVRLTEDVLSKWNDDLWQLSLRFGHYVARAQKCAGACADIEVDEIEDISSELLQMVEEIDRAVEEASE